MDSHDLLMTVFGLDGETAYHSVRVAFYTRMLCLELGCSSQETDCFVTAAMLHDLGKALVPKDILEKPGRLDEHEFRLIRQHPVWSAEMVGSFKRSREVIRSVFHHHERFDGRGYPCGLRADEIPRGSKIIAVADAYDAMTSERAYSKAKTPGEALEEIINCAGSQFDPEMAERFVATFGKVRNIRHLQPAGQKGFGNGCEVSDIRRRQRFNILTWLPQR